MAKVKISEFSSTPGNNTDIDGINIAEGCAPSGINDAIRELMAQLKDFQTGAQGDSFNGPVGTSTAAAGAFITLSASGNVTLSGGTANGVAYLNGSKVLTTGSALTFDGTNFATTGSATATLLAATKSGQALVYVTDTSGSASQFAISAQTGSETWLGTTTNNALAFRINGSEQMRLTSTGLGIGTSSPDAGSGAKLTVKGIYLDVGGNDAGYGTQLIASSSGVSATSIIAPTLTFWTGANLGRTEAMRLDSSGNLGLGVTPSAWASGWRAMDIGAAGSVVSPGSADMRMFTNAYWNGSSYIYKNTGAASAYLSAGGAHNWQIAPSGTAGNAISFSQSMTLDASGNLMLGTTTQQGRLHVSQNGVAARFTRTNNTDQFIEINGGDGAGVSTINANFTMALATGGTERARIDSSGNLIQTVNTTAATLATNGTLTFSIVDNSTLRISVRGSDGTTRTATVALT